MFDPRRPVCKSVSLLAIIGLRDPCSAPMPRLMIVSRRASVASTLKCSFALVASICIADLALPSSASAITVEVARQCSALANKAYPPRRGR